MDEPYNYSEETIQAIVDRDEETLADEDNDTEKPNIIFLQLETFSILPRWNSWSFPKIPFPISTD